ncbi:MAG: hypothetical protein HY043_03800 [Verrucomicrobia bacterium]|nr:hypothetical protein [Verrucomicrobiota bacterium]
MTASISTKGQIVLPKQLRELDKIQPADDFHVTRLGPGKYLYQRIQKPRQQNATLTIGKDGLPIFRVPKGAPRLTTEEVKRLEAELP